jgi:hypothetical protein
MKPETERRLGTIEVLLEKPLYFRLPYHEDSAILKPYAWDSAQLGKFTLLNLIQVNDWIRQTDPEVAIENWHWSEQTGLAAKGLLQVDHSCQDDDKRIFLKNETKQMRKQAYQALLAFLKANLQNLKAYTLSLSQDYYSLSIVVGQLPNQRWLCISPTVPQETPNFTNSEMRCSAYTQDTALPTAEPSEIETEIAQLLEQFDPIQIYGWYEGGYNHVHNYELVYAVGDTDEIAIEQALSQAGLITTHQFESFKLGEQLVAYDEAHAQELAERFMYLNQFLKQVFSEILLYRFCFWDYEHLYLLNNTSPDDQVGIKISSQFTYNP